MESWFWGPILALPLASCVTMGKLLTLSEHLSLSLKWGMLRINETKMGENLAWWWHTVGSINDGDIPFIF